VRPLPKYERQKKERHSIFASYLRKQVNVAKSHNKGECECLNYKFSTDSTTSTSSSSASSTVSSVRTGAATGATAGATCTGAGAATDSGTGEGAAAALALFCCWATMSAGFIWSMFIDASILAMKSSPLLLNAEGFVVAAGAATVEAGPATGLGLGAAAGAAGGATAVATGAGGSSSETGLGCCTKDPRLAGAGDAFTGVVSSVSPALDEEVAAAPAVLLVLLLGMRIEE